MESPKSGSSSGGVSSLAEYAEALSVAVSSDPGGILPSPAMPMLVAEITRCVDHCLKECHVPEVPSSTQTIDVLEYMVRRGIRGRMIKLHINASDIFGSVKKLLTDYAADEKLRLLCPEFERLSEVRYYCRSPDNADLKPQIMHEEELGETEAKVVLRLSLLNKDCCLTLVVQRDVPVRGPRPRTNISMEESTAHLHFVESMTRLVSTKILSMECPSRQDLHNIYPIMCALLERHVSLISFEGSFPAELSSKERTVYITMISLVVWRLCTLLRRGDWNTECAKFMERLREKAPQIMANYDEDLRISHNLDFFLTYSDMLKPENLKQDGQEIGLRAALNMLMLVNGLALGDLLASIAPDWVTTIPDANGQDILGFRGLLDWVKPEDFQRAKPDDPTTMGVDGVAMLEAQVDKCLQACDFFTKRTNLARKRDKAEKKRREKLKRKGRKG